MDKHLLVTISDDTSAHRGLKFVCGFFHNKQDIRLTLFNTAPLPPAVWGEETSYETLRQTEETAQIIIASSKRAMESARGIFLSGGFAPGQVDDKIVARNFSRIEDISEARPRGGDWYVRGCILRVERTEDGAALVSVDFPADRYYLQETLAGEAERLMRESDEPAALVARVGRGGSFAVVGLELGGRPLEELAAEER